MIDQMISDMAEGVIAQKEEQIKAAIDYMIGEPWSINDIAGRGEMKIYPDKTEVFVFDGVELIRFYPIETITEQKGISTFFKLKQPYELLYYP